MGLRRVRHRPARPSRASERRPSRAGMGDSGFGDRSGALLANGLWRVRRELLACRGRRCAVSDIQMLCDVVRFADAPAQTEAT